MSALIAAGLDSPATYLQWGWLQVSTPNAIIIAVMVIVFVLALVLPFPGAHGQDRDQS